MNIRITTQKQTGVFCETCARNLLGSEVIDKLLRRKRALVGPKRTTIEATTDPRACRLHNLGKNRP